MSFPVIFAVSAMSLSGCISSVKGSGVHAEQPRSVGEFSKVSVGGAFEVFIEVGKETKVVLEGDDNVLPLVRTVVKGDELRISTSDDISHHEKLVVRITTPKLVALDLSGAVEVTVKGINSERFEVDASGATEIHLEGKTGHLVIDASGASEIKAKPLIAERVSIDASGASEITVHASKALSVDISGAGEVNYAGHPTELKQDVSGAASIRSIN